MPYHIQWVAEKRVLLTTMTGTISRAELERFIEEIRAEIRAGTPIVYHISNSLALEKVELSLKAFQELLKSISMFGELGMQVDINHHALNKMLASFASQFVKVRTRTVTSMDDAVTLLKRIDPSLETVHWELPAAALEAPSTDQPPQFASPTE